jgi:FHA domain
MDPPIARLEVISGKAAGMSILIADELQIGRNAEGAGRLANDDEISRSHASVMVDATGRCTIDDLGSTNGTFVNGQRIAGRWSLAVGDTIELGGTVLVVRDLPTAPEVEPTVAPTVGAAAPEPEPTVISTTISAPIPDDTELYGPEEVPDRKPAPTRLSLQLDAELTGGELTIASDGSMPLRLVFEDGAWRPAP